MSNKETFQNLEDLINSLNELYRDIYIFSEKCPDYDNKKLIQTIEEFYKLFFDHFDCETPVTDDETGFTTDYYGKTILILYPFMIFRLSKYSNFRPINYIKETEKWIDILYSYIEIANDLDEYKFIAENLIIKYKVLIEKINNYYN